MSFLTGILNVGKSAVKFLSGNSIYSSLAKTAILGLAVNKLSKSALKGNDIDSKNIDQGVRLQAKPDAAAKIPVLYGGAFFGGNITDAAMTNDNKTMWYCLVLSEKTGNLYSTSSPSTYQLVNVYWNNQRIIFNADGITANYAVDSTGVIDRSISGLVRVYFYAGSRTAGQVPNGYTGTVPNAETLFPNWTSGTHAMSNLVFALVRVDYNRERNVTGIGNLLFNVTNSMKFPGDVVYDYLTNTTYGAGIDAAYILTPDITALNTYSDDTVAYDDQGTGVTTLGDRYQINGLIDTAQPVLANAEKILSSAASWLSYDTHQGKWGVVINKADTSVASFDDSNILGNISLSGTGLQDLYNEVKVEFPHRELRDSADFYNIEVPDSSIPADWADFSRNSNEEDNVLNLAYDIVNEPIQAQMLGLIELKQSRLDKIIQFETDFSYYNLKAGDIIDVTNTRFSFSAKLFRIVAITERQEDAGALTMEITALEYNANVYSVADLFRFTRSDNNGIITLGSIGQPGTPAVTKIEQDARPRVEISSATPTGVVEGMEFWLTTDVGIADDVNRSYTLIGLRRPVGGGVFTSGTNVTLEFVTSASDFFVKTRGINATTVGLFSAVSGLVEFAPVQVTDALDINTQAFDSTGALIGALALVDLIGKLSELFPAGSDNKSIFDRVFEIFEEETGLNLPDAITGGDDLGIALDVVFQSTLLTENLQRITFTGNGFTSGSGSDGNIVIASEFPVTVKTPEIISVTSGGSASLCAGGTITVTADTQCLPCLFDVPNFTYPYTISGISASDIAVLRLNNVNSSVNMSGSITVNPQTGLAEIEIELANTVGAGVSNVVTITIDGKSVSKTVFNPAAESYNVFLSSSNIKEGDTFNINITTQGVPNGTTIPWTLSVGIFNTAIITSPQGFGGSTSLFADNIVIQNNAAQITIVTQDNNEREFNTSTAVFNLFSTPGSAPNPPPQNPCNTIVTSIEFNINERSDVWAGCRQFLPITYTVPPSDPVVTTQVVTFSNKGFITSKWCAEFRTADKNAANALWTPYYIIQEDLIYDITFAAGTNQGQLSNVTINGVVTDTTSENYFEIPGLLSLNISTGAVTVVGRLRISTVHASPNFGGYPYYVATAFNNLASWTWPNYGNSRLMGSASQVIYANFNGWGV